MDINIGYLEQKTGISCHTLRAWERRYGYPMPKRSENGFRVYSSDEIDKIILLRDLSEKAYKISSIVHLSLEELKEYKNKISYIEVEASLLNQNKQLKDQIKVLEQRLSVFENLYNICTCKGLNK